MTDLVHRLLIARETPVERLWNGGDAFRAAWRLLTKRDGMFCRRVGPWRDCLRPYFHPSQHDASRSQQWLREHAKQFTVVGRARGTGLIR